MAAEEPSPSAVPTAKRPKTEALSVPDNYLSVGACLGYDAPYLLEWIEFHRLVGVERFFLYNNGDRPTQRELLEPYVRAGTVVLHEWPAISPQVPAYADCVWRHRRDSRWIAFIDTDEFLFSPTGSKLSEVLKSFEPWPGLGVCRAFFGTGGHRSMPSGLVIENYLRRIDIPGDKGGQFVKSIVDPKRTVSARNPHRFYHNDGVPVDENRWPLGGETGAVAKTLSLERIRINHYWTRSEEELARKFARRRADTGDPYPEGRTVEHMRDLDAKFGVEDEEILQFVPALREALQRASAPGAVRPV